MIQSSTNSRNKTKLSDYEPSPWLIPDIFLDFELDPLQTVVSSEFVLVTNPEYRPKSLDPQEVFLMGEKLILDSIEWDGQILNSSEYKTTDKGIHIFRSVNSQAKVKIRNQISPKLNTELLGLYQSSGIFCTQNEPEGFRHITYFLDRPDILSRYKVRIRANNSEYPFLLSNGNRIESGFTTNNQAYVIWEDPFPKPSYLFALVAGNLAVTKDQFKTSSGRVIDLEIYTNLGNEDKTTFAMESLKLAMAWDEEKFGLEYDLDLYMIVAVDDFNMGAMENKGLNIFNSKLVLASPETTTDTSYEDILSVIAHEYFHNWSGNRVTLRDWFQLTLKEGLTVFRDQLFSQDKIGADVKRIDDVDFLRNFQFPEDQGLLSHPIQPKEYLDIDNFYTRTVYEKGAEVIRIAYNIIGQENFRKAMDLYFSRYDGMAVTTEEFVTSLEEASGYDLGVFRNWYHRKGTPQISIREEYSSDTGEFTIHWRDLDEVNQQLPLVFPVKYSLYLDHKKIESDMFIWEGYSGSKTWKNLFNKPILSIFQNFTVPVILDYPRELDEIHFLWANDDDAFVRWDSGNYLKYYELNRLIGIYQENSNQSIDSRILDSYKIIISNIKTGKSDLRFLAYLLEIPGINQITNLQPEYNIEGSQAVIEIYHNQISSHFQNEFLEVYEFLKSKLNQSNLSRLEASGIRFLKNHCLNFLVHREDLIYEQFRKATNLTDELASLKLLTRKITTFRQSAIEEFRDKWKQNPLVMDHWLQIQASSEIPNALDEVSKLKQSVYFDLKNPNRVASLLGSFSKNRLRFHSEDGKGYKFLVDSILELDSINSQSAARLTKSFSDIAKLPITYRERAIDELKRLHSEKKLSNLVFELVDSFVDA
ncbi:aminopeptidase N [Leptospira sp. GIMC2001]|uniref:aminopeptidase N n=1 Tax=Leptospira sp. GIMC2001 TaxID=1513297 RepID=UPI00234A275C|nr:aminopeptidase N [Leptospira sp. GIMC2001]WCL48073.1 aminopeptidase N [Leptospira sp. GIMC2001]